MGLFGNRRNRRRLRALEGAPEGVAVIRESRWSGSSATHDDTYQAPLNVLGTRPYDLTLEVRLPGQEPYAVSGRFDVPRKSENVGFLGGPTALSPGIELPVRVDPRDPQSVAVDWDRFVADPGRKDAVRAADERDGRVRVAQHLAKNPKLQAKTQASGRQRVEHWAGAVRAGGMSRADYDKTVAGEVEAGRIHPDDAEAGRALLDGPPA